MELSRVGAVDAARPRGLRDLTVRENAVEGQRVVRDEAGAIFWAVLLQAGRLCSACSLLASSGDRPGLWDPGTFLSQPQPAAQVLLLEMSGVPVNTPSAPDGVQLARPWLFPKGRDTNRLLSPQAHGVLLPQAPCATWLQRDKHWREGTPLCKLKELFTLCKRSSETQRTCK